MKKCPSCGFNNPETRARCLKCSAALDSQVVPDAAPVADRPTPRANFLYSLRRWTYLLGTKLGGTLPTDVGPRYPVTAGYLGLFFGAGQFYNRQPLKAVCFAVIQLVLVGLFLYTFFVPANNLVLIGLLFWLFYAMADAYVIAARINGAPWRWRQVVAMWFGFMFVISASIFVLQVAGYGVIYFTTVQSDALDPVFRRGDKVFVLGRLFSSDFKPGAVVYYDPGRYSFEVPGALASETVIVNEMTSFGVVTATEGEVVAWRDGGPILIDGVPVPAKRLPINPNGTPGSYELRIPPDHYAILMTHGAYEGGAAAVAAAVKGVGRFGTQQPDPRQLVRSGYLLRDYEESSVIKNEHVFGHVLFCYYPPQRRRWFGFSGGAWKDTPDGYPEAAEQAP